MNRIFLFLLIVLISYIIYDKFFLIMKNNEKEEYDNFDIDKYEKEVTGYEEYRRTVEDDSKLNDFEPKKISKMEVSCLTGGNNANKSDMCHLY
jgi:hypothetical protein